MKRCVVSVATDRYVKGLDRLAGSPILHAPVMAWRDSLPPGSPTHEDVPYAFKAYALKAAADEGHEVLLWCDACILPGARSFNDLWDKIQRDGYWFSRNGYRNSQWTSDSAYADLFPNIPLDAAKRANHEIQHVVATSFGINLKHPIGCAFLNEYFRLANTKAFCGPWTGGIGVQHRHDQTCASVIASRLKMKLTNPPDFFAYKHGETEATVLIADGGY